MMTLEMMKLLWEGGTPDKIDSIDNLNFVSQYCPTKFAPMIVVGLMTYLVCFQSGLGPIPWIVNSEIYPLWFRSYGVSLSTGFNWALNIMVSYTFLLLLCWLVWTCNCLVLYRITRN